MLRTRSIALLVAASGALAAMPSKSYAVFDEQTLTGRVFCDQDGDGSGAGDPGVAGVDVLITNDQWSGPEVATTDANGVWTLVTEYFGDFFITVPAGQTELAGGTATTSTPLFVSLDIELDANTTTTDLDFGFSGVCAEEKQSLSGRVYCDLNRDESGLGDPGIATVMVNITLGSTVWTVATDGQGAWTFDAPSAGTYSITIPTGQAALDNDAATTTQPVSVTLAAGQNAVGVDFGYFGACAGWVFGTYTQGGWGAPPNGNNPGAILANNFSRVFPNGITVGSKYTMKFTSASAVEAFLPAGGTPSKLGKSATNPTSTAAGVFAGQVLALKINVAMSGLVTPLGFGSLVLHDTGTSLDGKTVAQILAAAEAALGGGSPPSGYKIPALNDLVTHLNEAFDNGDPSAWAFDHL